MNRPSNNGSISVRRLEGHRVSSLLHTKQSNSPKEPHSGLQYYFISRPTKAKDKSFVFESECSFCFKTDHKT